MVRASEYAMIYDLPHDAAFERAGLRLEVEST